MVRSLDELIDFEDVLAEQLRDPEFKAEWERLAAARAVADLVENSRMRLGLSQRELALRAGVSQPVISRIESGEHSPTIETLIKLANALDIEIVLGITPASHETREITLSVNGASHSIEVTAALGANLLVAAS